MGCLGKKGERGRATKRDFGRRLARPVKGVADVAKGVAFWVQLAGQLSRAVPRRFCTVGHMQKNMQERRKRKPEISQISCDIFANSCDPSPTTIRAIGKPHGRGGRCRRKGVVPHSALLLSRYKVSDKFSDQQLSKYRFSN